MLSEQDRNEELERGNEATHHTRREFEILFESAPIGYFVLNKEGNVVDVNLYGANLLQADRKSLYHKPFVVFVPDENHRQFFDHLQRVFDEARIQSHEMPIIDRRGRRIWGRLESRLQVAGDGSPRCFMAVIDVTDRKRVEDDLILAREDAVQASRAKNLFLANMSHEIRTPMNAVLAMSELTLDTPLNDEQREWIRIIQDSAKELTRIIDDVLDFSRIEANKLKIENGRFNLHDLIESARSLFAPQAAENELTLRVEAPPDLHPWYNGDQHRIRQVIHNLIANALKFTERGEVALVVKSHEISEFLHELTFEVRDTGIGIKDNLRESIFESFQQGDISYSKTYQGTGLGLSISRRLAKLMSGQLYFTSRENQGSTFYFTVPLHTEAEPHDASPVEPESSRTRHSEQTDDQPKRYVLVAEDNAVNTFVVQTILERAGYRVRTAANGNEVLEQLRHEPVDLVLMDISMPELDGMQTTARIRSGGVDGVDPALPIVAITAHSLRGDRERFLSAGMDDYLAKPFGECEILDVIDRLLQPGVIRGQNG